MHINQDTTTHKVGVVGEVEDEFYDANHVMMDDSRVMMVWKTMVTQMMMKGFLEEMLHYNAT